MAYVAGYLLRKTYSKHKCEKCSVLSNNNRMENQNVFMMFKAYESSSTFSGLVVPSADMFAYAKQLEDAFMEYFSNIKKKSGIGEELKEILATINLNVPCENFVKLFLIELFIRMRIYYCLKYIKREPVATKRKNRKYIKLVHL